MSGDRTPALLLISPGIIKWTDMDFGLPHLVSIGGYVQEHTGVRVEILDLNYEGGDHRHLERTLDDLGPFCAIGLSCYSSFDYLRVMTLGRFLKELYPDVPLITGGYHASALPGDVIFDGSPFDVVIPGEGELAMAEIVKTLLGGGTVEPGIHPRSIVPDLDELPPYRWELLERYWPRAHDIGRKFQIYLARGCPYRCTFCMERAKSGYTWRAYSAERAIAELERLSTFTDLSRWVVNLADPLFGFKRSWRRQVLQGIIDKGLLPRQYWTLTRSDDLDDEDVSLLARANFSIGIGMESGSPEMLTIMSKGNKPDRYLMALERLSKLSRKHGLNWAANIIVGHPGETVASMTATRDFLTQLFTSASETCGWLSIDPFRLYPGSQIHEQMDTWEKLHGAHFYHREWWKSWYDAPFRAEHLDASSEVDFETRVRFMYDNYAPLVNEIIARFRGQGRSIDRVFQRSLSEQAELMSPVTRDRVLARAKQVEASHPRGGAAGERTERAGQLLRFPIGLHVKDPKVRRREGAVRRLLHEGILRTDRITEALLEVAPENYLPEADVDAMLRFGKPSPSREGTPPAWIAYHHFAMALEALNPGVGERIADVLATSGYAAAVFAELVGPTGAVHAIVPGTRRAMWRVRKQLSGLDQVSVARGEATTAAGLDGEYDGVWLGAALPRLPGDLVSHIRDGDGRLVTWLGPRFRPQDLVSVSRRGKQPAEHTVARGQVPIVAGPNGWLRAARVVA